LNVGSERNSESLSNQQATMAHRLLTHLTLSLLSLTVWPKINLSCEYNCF